ncbi:hypothetical protein M427DRAFT_55680 [Gonapodya prolifera JEL478]|uniref:Uncharacterized protein n=1 Tax=Gonapodya prolifera (strain JEL478) TaxID=1344416 RepID=A0A139AHP4_GONPJ|nr:hypothetical protein M427DRAFT_55680 [Gonapodya prolifera JEL478]|eukprot:KXS16248.1 hypothetical protein M427DRAFT_55680 [Gonapodya prolifera JEL478]
MKVALLSTAEFPAGFSVQLLSATAHHPSFVLKRTSWKLSTQCWDQRYMYRIPFFYPRLPPL